ncbi:vWFA domain containing protein [Halapricum desulfuricans]|uniref:VWFA domain containing protein n=1 Tax=Halapricum desulfuricans TaxID=2841257 RepID=A0A897NGL3_9EURY|nr:vWA domain-containing protein [Halapricum desulfuricans]QSG11728.1 vWFA domain containing protein [Halapricum desulfuricans]
MSDEFELSRRKVLGGLTTIGVAGAAAGFGTSAYFSDRETFEDNSLVAGSLDLKVDWWEHYYNGFETEIDVELTKNDPANVPEDYVGLPDPDAPLVAVPSEDLVPFMQETSLEAYPDLDDDGTQDLVYETGDGTFEYYACDDGADTPEDLNPDSENGYRTASPDTILNYEEWVEGAAADPAPLINLQDVKPGDFGEVTFSFHLCDNPGYVWMFADNVEASENELTEPEMKDPDEDQMYNETGDIVLKDPEGDEDGPTVELLDAVQTVWWYDTDGDNVLDTGTGEPVCAHLVLDSSGSMTSTDGDGVTRQDEMKTGAKQLAQAILGANDGDNDNTVGVTEFDDDANVLTGQTSDLTTVENQIDSVDASGGTAIDAGINTGDGELGECGEDTRHVMIVVTDGQNNSGIQDVQDASDAAIGSNTDEIFAVGTGGATQASLEAIADPDDEAHISLTTDLGQAIAALSEVLLDEEVIFRGSLRESLGALTTDDGIPLDGNRQTEYDEIAAIGDETNPENGIRECFAASDTAYVGFAWYLPVDHANEIQTDSAMFDIGFYTEQCRHNDGAGMPPETTPNGNETSGNETNGNVTNQSAD